MKDALELDGHSMEFVDDGVAAIEALRARAYDLLITALDMPRADGMEVVEVAHKSQPEMQIIVLAPEGRVDTAMAAIKLGAFDYLQKPISGPSELRMSVRRALERLLLINSQELMAQQLQGLLMPRITWGAEAMIPVVTALEEAAKHSEPVMLVGEPGVGEEDVARYIHKLSDRKDASFTVFTCATGSESQLRSDLFGHEQGSFLGADQRQRGRLEFADGGTILLDEVGELLPVMQHKLYEALTTGSFVRAGGSQLIEVDVRVIASTTQELEDLVEVGEFMPELYEYLSQTTIEIPPLRERSEDIGDLAKLLLKRVCWDLGRPNMRMSREVVDALAKSSWPGNMRELKNALERAVLLADGKQLEPKHFTQFGASAELASSEFNAVLIDDEPITLKELERRAIIAALRAVDGNRKRAAERLDIGLRTLYDKIKRYNINE